MSLARVDLSAIPIHPLAHRRLRLGPFGSGRDLVKFLCVAAIGATVAAVTSAVVWLPFLAIGALIALVRVEGRSLDDFVLDYCRFQWRSTVGVRNLSGRSAEASRRGASSRRATASVRAGGIPIAYLPPQELQRLFEEWRSILGTFDRPVGCRMRGEVFSPLPFLPSTEHLRAAEKLAADSYRDLVRALLRKRFRRTVDLTVWNDPADKGPAAIGLQAQLDELVGALERLGIPARSMPPDSVAPPSILGAAS
jgi:hypothetical protein